MTQARNTNKSIQDETGFILSRIRGWSTVYIRRTSKDETVWISRNNVTILNDRDGDTWFVFITTRDCKEQSPVASGFKTHHAAKQWAVDNIQF